MPPGSTGELVLRLEEFVRALVECEKNLASMSDEQIAEAQEKLMRARRALDARMLMLVREMARRSSPQLGRTGMAARLGFRSVAELLVARDGFSREQADKYLAVSSQLDSGVGAAVLAGTISVDAAYAILRALPRGKEDSVR
jgi:hypothetical protein